MNSKTVYEVYIDILYGNCLVMNYLILTLTGSFLKRSATRLRRISAAAGCALLNCVCLLSGLPGIWKGILGYGVCSILALVFVYRLKAGEGVLLSGVICMYLLSFLFGGCFSFIEERIPYLREHGYTMLALIAFGCVLFELILEIHRKLAREKKRMERLYRVQFLFRNREYSCIGLYDTGNQLYEPIRQIPVCMIDREILPDFPQTQADAVVPFHSLGCSHGLLYAVFVEVIGMTPLDEDGGQKNLSLSMKKRVLVGIYEGHLSSAHTYQMILHPDVVISCDNGKEALS